METEAQDDLKITEQAHDWFATLPQAGAKERAAFAQWLKASPRNVGEFLNVTAVYRDYSGLDAAHIDVDALIAEASSNVVPLQDTAKPPAATPLARRRFIVVAAAIAGLAVISGATLWTAHGGQHYATAMGELRSLELADGSVIDLNTQSKVRVLLTAEGRDIQLLEGEALFKVATDPARPFRVHSGDAVIQAIGTQFNVYRRAQGTKVSVIEGRVSVAEKQASGRQILDAGDEVEVTAGGKISRKAEADATKVTAWRERRLIFRGDPLTEVVAQFNRYNRTPRFRIADSALEDRRFTGVFDVNAPESFIRVLAGVGDLAVEREGNEVLIRAR